MARSFLLAALFSASVARAQDATPPPLLARPAPESRPTAVLTGDQVWKFTLSHPTPAYPAQARRRHLGGTGLYELKVGETGEVASVTVVTSAGSSILDDAAVSALKQWRFRAHTTLTRVKLPITFTPPKVQSHKKT
jgi:periplasmic protein TonB